MKKMTYAPLLTMAMLAVGGQPAFAESGLEKSDILAATQTYQLELPTYPAPRRSKLTIELLEGLLANDTRAEKTEEPGEQLIALETNSLLLALF